MWINILDKKPEKEKHVLLCDKYGDICSGFYRESFDFGNFFVHSCESCKIESHYITHWKEFPNKPKEYIYD